MSLTYTPLRCRCGHPSSFHPLSGESTACNAAECDCRAYHEQADAATQAARDLKVTSYVHLVVMGDRGGLFGIYLEKERAHRYAESINGVVVALPVSGDYRKAEEEQG